MRRRVRRNIERQVARAQAFDEDSPLARKTPAEKKLDKDLTEAEFQLSLAKREALRAEEKFRLRNRTLLRKAADSAVKWRRALILADYVVLYKLGMAAGWRMAFTPTEEAIGTAISKALPGLSKNAPREFGGSVRAEAEALTQGFRYLVENFGKVLKHGVNSMDTKYSSKPDFNDLDPSLSDYIGNSHAAIKLLPKASEFYRSFRKRTEAALRNGIESGPGSSSPGSYNEFGGGVSLRWRLSGRKERKAKEEIARLEKVNKQAEYEGLLVDNIVELHRLRNGLNTQKEQIYSLLESYKESKETLELFLGKDKLAMIQDDIVEPATIPEKRAIVESHFRVAEKLVIAQHNLILLDFRMRLLTGQMNRGVVDSFGKNLLVNCRDFKEFLDLDKVLMP
jgi:hypothetical protein